MRLGPALVCACVLVATVACTDDGDEAAPTTASPSTAIPGPENAEPPVERAMFWTLKSGSTVPANASDFDLLYEGSGCEIDGDTVAWSELARVDVDESADRVLVTVWQRPSDDPRLPQDHDDCLGLAIGIPAHVKLAAPVGTRTIVDGFCSIDPSKAIDVSPDLKDDVCDRVGISAL